MLFVKCCAMNKCAKWAVLAFVLECLVFVCGTNRVFYLIVEYLSLENKHCAILFCFSITKHYNFITL